MKRDFEFLRGLLIEVEETPISQNFHFSGWKPRISQDGVLAYKNQTAESLLENMEMLKSAGLIKGNLSCNGYGLVELTWKGHEFLSLTRDPKIWSELMLITNDPNKSYDLDYLMNIARTKLNSQESK